MFGFGFSLTLLMISYSRLSVATFANVLSIAPNGSWDGNDGPWSSFSVSIGSPPQSIRVLPSSSSSSIWSVVPIGCNSTTDPANCTQLRGGSFDVTKSSTWVQKGIYNLPIDFEVALGYNGNGQYGFDTVHLPQADHPNGSLTLNNTLLAGIATKDFFVGSLGMSPSGVNFTQDNTPVSSFMIRLFETGQIGSRSWGYTAGSVKQSVLGSLTFGGYDASRFVPNSMTFARAAGPRDLMVGVQTITAGTQSLLPHGIMAPLDSTAGQIWLPEEACQRFEEVFGLVWDNNTRLYLVNDALHAQLVQMNAEITFTLGTEAVSHDIINIKMPYSSFDLVADWPLTSNGSNKYFPLRRAVNESQYVLGRPFFQNSYVVVDYDRNNFSVSQAILSSTQTSSQMIAIVPPESIAKSQSKKTVIGASVGAALAIIILCAVIWRFGCYPYRDKLFGRFKKNTFASSNEPQTSGYFAKAELDGHGGSSKVVPNTKYDNVAVNWTEMDSSDASQSTIVNNDSRQLHSLLDSSLHLAHARARNSLRPELVGNNGAAELSTDRLPAELRGDDGAAELPGDGQHFINGRSSHLS